jgi:hypothetical protein
VGTVHVFISTGHFRSLDEMRAFIDETYTEDGDGIPSAFMNEVGLDEYEPHCIEAFPSQTGQPILLTELLAGASYSDQWLSRLDGTRLADAAICMFPPNEADHPEKCSLEFIGAFEYRVVHPEWFQQLLKGEDPKAAADVDSPS